MKCPSCDIYLPAKAITCGECGWVREKPLGNALVSPPSCNFCHHKNPFERMKHWIAEASHVSGLEHHLKAEFPRQYGVHAELNHKIREVLSERSRFTDKYCDEGGRFLSPEAAFAAHYSMSNPRNAESIHAMHAEFEKSLSQFIEAGDLRKKPGESKANFILRCKSFAAMRKRNEKSGPLDPMLRRINP